MAEKVEKERLDVLLVQQGLANSRELAKAYIMAGNVYVDGQKEDKAGTKVAVTAKLEVKGNQMKYVSRGGYKLEKAMDVFGIRLDGKICLDIGASTGGFTDCMLQNGASKVYAIDVGYGQFAWKLRNDERVVCLEKTNVRYVTHEQVPDEGDFASIDVSFISLTKVLPAVLGVLEVIEMIVEYVRTQSLGILGLDFSPIKGPEGNIEYLIYLDKSQSGMHEDEVQARVDTVVAQSHKILSGEK